jgi:hypothetical protein
VVVPDDARELEPDRQAWLREVRRARWRARVRRLVVTRSGRPRPVALLATLLVALLGATTALAGTVLSRPTARYAPLAHPGYARGQVGGLLPAVTLQGRGGRLPTERLRPAALVLVPSDCACPTLLRSVARAASQVGVHALAVGADGTAAQDAALDRLVLMSRLDLVVDPHNALASALAPPRAPGPRLALVRADGVITALLDGTALRRALDGLEVRLAQLPVVPGSRSRR